MAEPQRILIIRPSALGDVCRTVPVLVSLRRAWPGATIDWIVRDGYIEAIDAHPDLSEAIAFPRRELAQWWWKPTAAAATWRWFRSLHRRGYDLVLDCQGLGRSGLMTFASGAGVRIGHRDAREGAWLAYNERVVCPNGMHTVDRMLQLLDPLGIDVVRDMRLYVADSNAQWWCQQRQQHDLSDRNYAVLAPTSRWLSKRWPILRWGALIEPLRVLGLNRCVVIGAPGERDQVQALLGGPAGAGSNSHESVVDLVGCATVGQTMAVIAGSSLLIANDSAPLHMAVGLDIPCVGLFGPTNPDEVGPYEKSDSVIRCVDAPLSSAAHFKNRTLGDALMQRITAEAVVDRARAVLNDASTKRSEV